MNKPHGFGVSLLAALVAISMTFVPVAGAQQPQHAGQVARIIPAVNIERAGQAVAAAEALPVFWGDVVVTQKLARARIDLDDGSVINVGSETSLRIVKHDVTNQQTELELTYGRIRSQAVHLTKPGASYKVRTPTAVAGVIGTDFVIIFYGGITHLIVYQGVVQFCNLALACVSVGQGLMSTIHGNGQAPDQPVPAPTSELVATARSVQSQPGGTGAGAGAGAGGAGGGAGGAAAGGGIIAQHAVMATLGVVGLTAAGAAATTAATKTTTCGCQKIVIGVPARRPPK